MNDLRLNYTDDGFELCSSCESLYCPAGLQNAVYLSLFVGEWWNNAISEEAEQYSSRIPEIMASGLLTNQVRLDVIEEAKESLKWLQTIGVITQPVEVSAEIPSVGRLNLVIKLYEPEQTTDFIYALNWDDQKIILQEAA